MKRPNRRCDARRSVLSYHKEKLSFDPATLVYNFLSLFRARYRVQRITESGREIVLYRVTANETCILTIASLLATECYSAEAITETEVVAYVLKAAPFKELMN